MCTQWGCAAYQEPKYRVGSPGTFSLRSLSPHALACAGIDTEGHFAASITSLAVQPCLRRSRSAISAVLVPARLLISFTAADVAFASAFTAPFCAAFRLAALSALALALRAALIAATAALPSSGIFVVAPDLTALAFSFLALALADFAAAFSARIAFASGVSDLILSTDTCDFGGGTGSLPLDF